MQCKVLLCKHQRETNWNRCLLQGGERCTISLLIIMHSVWRGAVSPIAAACKSRHWSRQQGAYFRLVHFVYMFENCCCAHLDLTRPLSTAERQYILLIILWSVLILILSILQAVRSSWTDQWRESGAKHQSSIIQLCGGCTILLHIFSLPHCVCQAIVCCCTWMWCLKSLQKRWSNWIFQSSVYIVVKCRPQLFIADKALILLLHLSCWSDCGCNVMSISHEM